MAATRLGIIDYGMGNVRSVQKVVEAVGGTAELATDAAGLDGFAGLVLPGVGNFADGMAELERRGLRDPLTRYAEAGRPLLGVCMGMQLLFESSTEPGGKSIEAGAGATTPGLALLPGRVVGFEQDPDGADRLKIPHMGWNTLEFEGPAGGLLEGLEAGCHVYFVHGYHVPLSPEASAVATSTCRHGVEFVATVASGAVWGAQFHPEKSQAVGLRMFRNFVAHVGRLSGAAA